MKTIQFTETQQINFHLGDGLETFHAGEQYTFERDDKAERWIIRGVAFEVEVPAPVENEDVAEMKRLAAEAKKKPK